MKYDFDEQISRRGTDSYKWDSAESEHVLPMWVADMDFEVCPAITEALRHRLEHQVFGYSIAPDSYWQSIQDWLLNRHRFSVERDELTFIPGIVRGLAMALQVFTDKGDKVLLHPVCLRFRRSGAMQRHVWRAVEDIQHRRHRKFVVCGEKSGTPPQVLHLADSQ